MLQVAAASRPAASQYLTATVFDTHNIEESEGRMMARHGYMSPLTSIRSGDILCLGSS